MTNWVEICELTAIAPNTGVCAKVGDQQVAIFFSKRTNTLHAISNFDPIGKANVLSRGILGSIEDNIYVASPLYKQHFDLNSGICLEYPEQNVKVFQVRENNGIVEVLD